MLYLIDYSSLKHNKGGIIDLEENDLDEFILEEADKCGWLDVDTLKIILNILYDEQKQEVLKYMDIGVFDNVQDREKALKEYNNE